MRTDQLSHGVLVDRSQMAKSKQQYQTLKEVEAAGAQIRLGNGTYVRAAYIAEGHADVSVGQGLSGIHHAKSMHCTATDCSVACIIGSLNYSASSRANAEAKRGQDTTCAAPSNGPAMNLLAQSPIATVGQRPRFAARSVRATAAEMAREIAKPGTLPRQRQGGVTALQAANAWSWGGTAVLPKRVESHRASAV